MDEAEAAPVEEQAVDAAEEGEQDSPFLIVDVEKRQSPERIQALRDGEGPLSESLFEVLEDLHAQGYIGDEVLPVVFVVREKSDDSEEE